LGFFGPTEAILGFSPGNKAKMGLLAHLEVKIAFIG